MGSIFAWLISGTGRRLIALAIGVLTVLLNKKLGLDLTPTDQGELIALIVAYIAGSNYKEGKQIEANLKATPTTSSEAADEVSKL